MTQPLKRAGGKIIKREVLGPYLRRQRFRLGLTQAEVADAAGLNRSLYSNYENSNRGMEVDKAPGLASALSVPEAEIRALAEERGVLAELSVQIAELRVRLDRLEKA